MIATDVAGNQTTISFNVTVVASVDQPLRAPDLDEAADSGSSNSDNITSETTLTLIGGDAQRFAEIRVTATLMESGIDTTAIANGMANVDGDYTVALTLPSPFFDGGWAVSVQQSLVQDGVLITSDPSEFLRCPWIPPPRC